MGAVGLTRASCAELKSNQCFRFSRSAQFCQGRECNSRNDSSGIYYACREGHGKLFHHLLTPIFSLSAAAALGSAGNVLRQASASACVRGCVEAALPWQVVANTVLAMMIAWLQPWFRRGREDRTPTLAAAISRLPFTRRHRPGTNCPPVLAESPRFDGQDIPIQRFTLSLAHHLDVSQAARYLMQHLDCDSWHVECRHDHQLVAQLTRNGAARYGVSFDCTPPVEKAVYHGSRTWALTIIPLHGRDNIPSHQLAEIKAGLAALHD